MSDVAQYLIVRKDLKSSYNWSYTSVIGQCVHAATSIIRLHEDDKVTKLYAANLEEMNIIVLGIEDDAALIQLANIFQKKTICHLLWKEPPLNVPSCIAIKPLPMETLNEYVKDLEVLKE